MPKGTPIVLYAPWGPLPPSFTFKVYEGGWGNDLACVMFAAQTRGPECEPQYPHKGWVWRCAPVTPPPRHVGWGDGQRRREESRASLVSQPN